jgi:hypothetical protein
LTNVVPTFQGYGGVYGTLYSQFTGVVCPYFLLEGGVVSYIEVVG